MPSRSREERKIVACLFMVLFMGVADNQILSPLLPIIRQFFSKSSADMGILISAYSFCSGISVLIWGPISDLFGRKNGLLSGLLVFSLGSLFSYESGNFALLLTGRVITGMGASMLSLNVLSYVADCFPYQSRGWAMGSVFSSFFASLILGVPLGSWLGDRLGWNSVFGAMGIFAFLLALVTYNFLPKIAAQPGFTQSKKPVLQILWQYCRFLKVSNNLGALLGALFTSAGITGFMGFLGVWLYDAFGIPGRKAGLVFLISGAAALIASPFAGVLSDRIGKRRQYLFSCSALAALLCVLPGLRWGVPLFIIFGLISTAAAFRQGPMEAMLSEMATAEYRGTFMALKNSFSQLGIGLMAIASGFLFEFGGYWPVCILSAVSNVLAVLFIFFALRQRDL
jgi:predicted MFS family arabinose efflux permease